MTQDDRAAYEQWLDLTDGFLVNTLFTIEQLVAFHEQALRDLREIQKEDEA